MYNGHDWESHLTEFDKNVLRKIGEDPDYLPTGHNPIVRALSRRFRTYNEESGLTFVDGTFVQFCENIPWFNKTRISRLASICQMKIYDATGGPDGDGERKGLRRHWYSWFKTQFAQEFSNQLALHGDKKEIRGFDGTAWAGRLSQTYGDLVDNEDVMYNDLWVSDTSRMIQKNWTQLFSGFHAILCVEKDSLFDDFKTAAKAVGITCLVSGKGKMSKAATELVLRKHFDIDYRDSFSEENPLYVLTITDWDFDGEAVIAPTFAQQARRYTPHVIEARVGIKPEDGIDADGPLFELKLNNAGYVDWAADCGIFELSCSLCEHEWINVGSGSAMCPVCKNTVLFAIRTKNETDTWTSRVAHGYEVEALPTRAYYGMIVTALLSVIPFSEIVRRLRKDCKADRYGSATTLTEKMKKWNPSYREMMKEFERLEEIKDRFEKHAHTILYDHGDGHQSDWEDLEDDPDADDFETHVKEARGYTEAWRPFDADLRTNELTLHILKNERADIVELRTMDIVDVFGS